MLELQLKLKRDRQIEEKIESKTYREWTKKKDTSKGRKCIVKG